LPLCGKQRISKPFHPLLHIANSLPQTAGGYKKKTLYLSGWDAKRKKGTEMKLRLMAEITDENGRKVMAPVEIEREIPNIVHGAYQLDDAYCLAPDYWLNKLSNERRQSRKSLGVSCCSYFFLKEKVSKRTLMPDIIRCKSWIFTR